MKGKLIEIAGTIELIKGKKGLSMKFRREDGKVQPVQIPRQKIQPEWDGKPGKITLRGGMIIQLILLPGQIIYDLNQTRRAQGSTQTNANSLTEMPFRPLSPQIGQGLAMLTPKFNLELFSPLFQEQGQQGMNYGLRLDRFPQSEELVPGPKHSEKRAEGVFPDTFTIHVHRSITKTKVPDHLHFHQAHFPESDLGHPIRRMRRLAKQAGHAMEFKYTPRTGLCIGLGTSTVYETGLQLEHLSGKPDIPGSGLKGSLRNFILLESFEGDEEQGLKNALFKEIFGYAADGDSSKGMKGKVIFWGGCCEDNIRIEPDIMSPHYQPYYSWGYENLGSEKARKKKEKKEPVPPADWHDPVPIQFLRVKGKFRLFLSLRANSAISEFKDWQVWAPDAKLSETNRLSDLLTYWLPLCLSNQGIGAKTALGYGLGDCEKMSEAI